MADNKMKLPIMDNGVWWNGKPYKFSNLPQWSVQWIQDFAAHPEWYEKYGLDGHNGIDWAFKEDCPIVTPVKTFVQYAGYDEGYGNYVRLFTETIDGEFLEFVFAHLNEIKVTQGDWIDEGTLIGLGGSTGNSTGFHLHFGIRIHETLPNGNTRIKDYDNGYFGYKDPAPYFPQTRWTVGELESLKDKSMITYKKVGETAVYFAVGTKLIPFATTWEDYLIDFEDAVLVELSEAEFSKFTIAQAVEVKSK